MKRTIIIAFCVVGLISKIFGGEKSADKPKDFPPVPAWQPDIEIPLEKIIDRFRYYTDNKKDFVILKHGTCVLASDGLTDEQARKEALETVSRIFNYHPDMNPKSMDDGNILVFYNHPAYTVVLEEVTKQNMDTIRTNHLKALIAWLDPDSIARSSVGGTPAEISLRNDGQTQKPTPQPRPTTYKPLPSNTCAAAEFIRRFSLPFPFSALHLPAFLTLPVPLSRP